MTSHAPAIDLSHDHPPLPNQHFSSWLRSQTTLFISQIVAILGSISLVASTIYYVRHLGGENEKFTLLTVTLIVDFAHLAFIAIFILFLIQVLDDNERGSYRVRLVYERVFRERRDGEKEIEEALKDGKGRLRTFKRRFLWFWVGMLCLYVSFACQHIYEAPPKPPGDQTHTAAQSGEFTLSLKGDGHSGGKKEFKGDFKLEAADGAHGEAQAGTREAGKPELGPAEVRMKLEFSFWEFFFNNLTLMFVFWCFLVMYLRPEAPVWQEWAYLIGSLVVVLLLAFLFRWLSPSEAGDFTAATVGTYSAIFDGLSGVINAVVLALLIARLDSKLVGLPSWLISILYSYAAVQPLFIVFQLSHSILLGNIVTLVLIFVFIFKIYFFLIIFYALQTGKMLNYLTCFPILRRRAGLPEHGSRVGLLQRRGRGHASAFARLKEFVLSLFGKMAVRRRRMIPRRAHLHRTPKGVHPSAVPEPRGPAVSRLLRSRYTLWVSEVVGWVAIFYFLAAMVGSQVLASGSRLSNFLLPSAEAGMGFGVAQLVAVSLIVALLLLVFRDNDYGREAVANTARNIFHEPFEHGHSMAAGEGQLKKFKRYFLYFWLATFLLYVIFLLELRGYDPATFYGLFLSGDAAEEAKELFYPTFEFLLASLNLMFAFWCFVILQSPAFAKPASVRHHLSEVTDKRLEARQRHFEYKQKLLVNYSSFAIFLFLACFTLLLVWIGRPAWVGQGRIDYMTIFYGVTGLLSAIVLALLIARMDSKLFNLPSRLIWMLFAYASIQALFIAFPQDVEVLKMVRTSVLTSTLGLKICFFLTVVHSLQSGRVLNYLVCFPLLKERVDSIFENQFEIKLARVEEKEFTFSILKKNQLYYSTTRTFESRGECDEAVRELRGLMGKSESYGEPRESSGTYWLEVMKPPGEPHGEKTRHPQGNLLCESIPLRSEEEALDLMDESMSKVPYCKYNRL